jgi:predicted RNase H-like HicB family nuclease
MIHKDPDSCYGVSFPDVPGVITAGDTIEEAIEQASEVLAFAFEDWPGGPPPPRSIDELRTDPDFLEHSADAVLVAVEPAPAHEAAE